MKRVISLLMIITLIFLQGACLTSCKKPKTKYSDYYFSYFDTVTTISGYAETKEEFDSVCDEIEAILAKYHKLCTIYNSYEDLNNVFTINALVDGEHKVVTVDKELIEFLNYAKQMYTATDGVVNIAMGSVLKIWHNYRERGINDPASATLPPMEDLTAAAEHCDIEKLIIDDANNTVFLADNEMTLDVGAIAKGYATEKAAEYLEENGITGYILNVGGNIRTVGMADESDWKIGIENPDKEDTENPYIEYLLFSGESVVTSGSYQRYYEVDGVRYCHIIDPASLMPANKYLSVSVITDDSGFGDVMSTALFLMDFEAGKELVENTEKVEAMWVLPDGTRLYSSGFEDFTFEYTPN